MKTKSVSVLNRAQTWGHEAEETTSAEVNNVQTDSEQLTRYKNMFRLHTVPTGLSKGQWFTQSLMPRPSYQVPFEKHMLTS